MFIVKFRKIFFIISALLFAGSVFSMFYFGFNYGIDFNGGSVLEVSYTNQRPNLDLIKSSLDKLSLGNYSIQPSGDKNVILKTKELTQVEKNNVEKSLSLDGKFINKEERFNSVGPVVGNELRHKAYIAISVVVVCILLFITFAFRKVSEPVSSWKYGLITVISLVHNIVIPTGIYIVYAKIFGAEIDLLFITALLAVLGYSVHDTIVVFDRVRENLRLKREYREKEIFEDTVGKSVNQTLVRSINTSVTTLLALTALYFIGSEATKAFSFLLITGVVVGTYASIFFASPLLVTFEGWQKNK